MSVQSDRSVPGGAGVAQPGSFNRALVWEGGNQYSPVAPFHTVPSWWRRFIFAVLTPRDIAIYSYICSQTDQHAIAYPTYANIKADLNIANARIIKASLDTLNDYGFLMIRRLAPLRINRHVRNVYQRPCIEYTLRVLLDKDVVDGELHPRRFNPNARRGDSRSRDNGAVWAGLRALIGVEEFGRWFASPAGGKRLTLRLTLQARIDAKTVAWERDIAPTITHDERREAEQAIRDEDDLPDGFEDSALANEDRDPFADPFDQ